MLLSVRSPRFFENAGLPDSSGDKTGENLEKNLEREGEQITRRELFSQKVDVRH